MLKSLQLTSFRSFADTGRHELTPITLLVGKNSSGKSSFLRFFPLLRQTAEVPARSPLLWYGKLVDFGSFQGVASRVSPGPVGVHFQLTAPYAGTSRVVVGRHPRPMLNLDVSVELAAQSDQTYVAQATVRCNGDSFSVTCGSQYNVERVTVNGVDMASSIDVSLLHVTGGGLLPALSRDQEDLDDLVNSLVAKTLRPLAHNRTSDRKLLQIARNLTYGSQDAMLARLRALALRYWENPEPDHQHFQTIRRLLFLKEIEAQLPLIQSQIDQFASGITYLGPFRRHPDRFYRYQELAVGQIDAAGENLAMLLRSLDAAQIQDLSSFMQRHLGFHVRLANEGSHVAILLGDGGGRDYNLIDMGYGLSQVLPVVAQCWMAITMSSSGRQRRPTLLIVEQPELHLHPKHQSSLADVFFAVHAESNLSPYTPPWQEPLRVMVETHSEAMINRFGEMIVAGTLDPSHIRVLLFEKDESTGRTEVRSTGFSSDGILEDWPLGFFSA
jgi:hypothetical protein